MAQNFQIPNLKIKNVYRQNFEEEKIAENSNNWLKK
jgi:hypothetical protein